MRLTVKIESWFVNKIDKYAKMYSVWFVDYDYFMECILDSFNTVEELNYFRLCLYNAYCWYVEIKRVRKSELNCPEESGYRLTSENIYCSADVVAQCLPLHIRRKFFDYDKQLGRFFAKCDLIYHLYN